MPLDELNQLQPAAVGQAHIGQAEVVVFTGEALACLLEVACAAGVQLHPAEGDLQQLADVRFVVDDQRFLAGSHGLVLYLGRCRGRAAPRNLNVNRLFVPEGVAVV